MRAVVQGSYGDPDEVLEVRDVDRPVVADDEALVRVRAASVHADVWHVVTGIPRVLRLAAGLRRPRHVVPGTDMVGQVEAVGSRATRLQRGDDVFGETIPGMQWRNGGTYAEYVTVAEDALAIKPPDITFEQAATVSTSGLIALSNLPDPTVLSSGTRVLVNGAGGGVGTIAVQVAHAAGAHVTAVDHARKHDLLTTCGADVVLDHTTDDVTSSDQPYDLVFDVVGSRPLSAYRRVLTPDGTYVLIGHDQYGREGREWLGSVPRMLGLLARSVVDRRLPGPGVDISDRPRSMDRLRILLERGDLAPVIARTFSLDEVADAIGLLAAGQALGRIVVVP